MPATPATNERASVRENARVAENIYHMKAEWGGAPPRAGQFFMLRAWRQSEAPLLSRPISVHDYDAETGTVSFLYETKGEGTQKLAALRAGDTLSLTGPAGNGFPLDVLRGKIAVVGGGIGIAPLLYLCRALAARGCGVDFCAGFRDEPYRDEAFRAVCENVHIATDSGKAGVKGLVTQLFKAENYDAICACGPEVMMRAVARMAVDAGKPVYVSKEAKMACGLGACLGCTCKGARGEGYSVCKDGPVFEGRAVYGDT